MPYKKESPFASFRDPKRATRNYNPTDFKMPDINSIFNKTADGETTEDPTKANDTDSENKINGKLLDNIDKSEEKPADITRKSLRQDRRAEEKEFNKKLRQARGLKNASTKDITAEDRGKAKDMFNLLKDEKDFRKTAKKAGFNPEDYRNLKFDIPTKIENKSKKADISPGAEVNIGNTGSFVQDDYSNFDLDNYFKPNETKKTLKNTKFNYTGFSPNERKAHRVLMGAGASTKDAFDYVTYNFADDETKGMIDRMKASEKEMEEYKKSKGLNMKQVNSKGSGFPMIQPNQNMAEPEQMKNRAGRPVESNILTNDPNIAQPMNKVPATTFQRNAQFNDIASGQGMPNPQPQPQQQVATTTPQAPIFPQPQQQGSFAAYSNPSRAIDTSSEEIAKGGRKMQEGMESLGDSLKKKEDKTEDAPPMYDGPSKALVGNQDRLPEHLKAKIEAAPGMYGDGPSMRSAFKAFENDHLKTKVTKGNLKATERDDAAHMSYLKRDVKYDNTHGGSNRQMLDDEKHISKLAGDLKYDARKKRS